MMKTFKYIPVFAFAAALSLLSGCGKWTEPQNKNFRKAFLEDQDPAKYASYLEDLKNFKKAPHKVMIVGMKGISSHPASQSQHIMAMPDSADYIFVKTGDALHSEIAAEIPLVKSKKGTQTLLFVDYAPVHEAWGLLEDDRAEKGLPPGTPEELAAFFKEKTEAQLARCKEYGFDGIYVSYIGNTATEYNKNSQVAYIKAVMDFHQANADKVMIFRGSVRNIVDKDFIKACKYLVGVAGEEKKLSTFVGRYLGSEAPKDRVIIELTVPSSENPVQTGSSVREGASWVVQASEGNSFTPCGLSVFNGNDDYFNKTKNFDNLRAAISIMNPIAKKD